MCSDKILFTDMRDLDTPQQVTLGDGSPLEGPAEGTVKLDMILPDGSTQNCKLKVTVLLINNFVGAKVYCLKVALLCLFCVKWT